MNVSDYIALAMLLLQIAYLFRHNKLTKKNLEQSLYNNREALGRILEDLLTKFGGK